MLIPDFEPQTKGIVRPNAPQRLSLAVIPLMNQRSLLFRVRTELGDGEVEDYSQVAPSPALLLHLLTYPGLQLSDNSEGSSLQLISAEPGSSDASSSTVSVPSGSQGVESASKEEAPSSSLSSASVYSQESYLLASSKHPLSGVRLLTPAIATAASATLAAPLSVHTPYSGRLRKAMPRTPLSSAKSRFRSHLRPRVARTRPRRNTARGGVDEEEYRRFAMAFSPSVALPWEAIILGEQLQSPMVNLEIAGLRASRGYQDDEAEGAWEDEPVSEEDDGSTTPKTGDPIRWLKAPKSGYTGDEAIRKNGSVTPAARRRPQSIIRSKLKAKSGHQRIRSEAPKATQLQSTTTRPPSAAIQPPPSAGVIMNNLPSFTPLRRALSRMTAHPPPRNEKADLPTGLRRTKSQLLSPVADIEAAPGAQAGSIAQYWSPATGVPDPAIAEIKGELKDADAPQDPPSEPADTAPPSQAGSLSASAEAASESPIPPPVPEKPTSILPKPKPTPLSTCPSSFPAPPPIPESVPRLPPPSPAPVSFQRKGHKRYLSSPALLNFRPSDLPAPPPPMPDLKLALAQLELTEKDESGKKVRATARASLFRSMERKEHLEEKKVLRKTMPAKRRSPSEKMPRMNVVRKEMIGTPVPIVKSAEGSA
ncbi:hypothetical protein NMY22_g8339 [Coprinellus aureogranulatus]|nr:hypothetical protein NMY22_g8339 [Coprinellus aureogranulatus]